VRRVLKPGGRFFFEEITSQALRRWMYRLCFDHPKENRFSVRELLAELDRQGIMVGTQVVERFFGDLIIGVGRVAVADEDGMQPIPGCLTKRESTGRIQ
jgi:hypothetical protein